MEAKGSGRGSGYQPPGRPPLPTAAVEDDRRSVCQSHSKQRLVVAVMRDDGRRPRIVCAKARPSVEAQTRDHLRLAPARGA